MQLNIKRFLIGLSGFLWLLTATIAVAGTAGYVLNGLASLNRPDWSLGFVYLPALAGIVATSMLTAPLGARLAHNLPVRGLKKVFALLLIIMGTKMLSGIL